MKIECNEKVIQPSVNRVQNPDCVLLLQLVQDGGLSRSRGRAVHLPHVLQGHHHEAGGQAALAEGADRDTARRQGKKKTDDERNTFPEIS